jgi:hypothetical protein
LLREVCHPCAFALPIGSQGGCVSPIVFAGLTVAVQGDPVFDRLQRTGVAAPATVIGLPERERLLDPEAMSDR